MQSQDVAPCPPAIPAGPVDAEQAEASLVEHYPRLVRLAYLVLPPALGRTRRVLTAHALTQRTLPHGRASTGRAPTIPAQPTAANHDHATRGSTPAAAPGPGYAYVRLHVLRTALEAGHSRKRRAWPPKRSPLPPLLPQVWGLRLFPRSGGADELALDQRLSALSGPARAAYVLRGLEKLTDTDVRQVLDAAGVEDPQTALKEAGSIPPQAASLLNSPEFDPCSLQARPTDLIRRRQHMRAALAATAAVAVCGTLLLLPGDGWGPDGAAAPPYAQNPAAEAALDPGRLTKVPATAWKTSARTDFSVWPARGSLTGDSALLRRALAVWARPGESVQVSATPGTPAGAPPGPPQLLYAGEVASARVVLLYDGLRIARYAEPEEGNGGAALDFARVDGATGAEATAVVLDRADGNVRYLTAPWVTEAAVRDLAEPTGRTSALAVSAEGVTAPFPSPALQPGECRSWNVIELNDTPGTGTGTGTRLVTDLGELTPAHLTAGRPTAPREVSGPLLEAWSPYACSLAAVRGQGVRSVNAWQYARQPLPDGTGTASWVCTRTETWRGRGARALAQFHAPGETYGAVAAQADDSPACGAREPHVLAGVLWQSGTDAWYLLAAGSRGTASVTATGGVSGAAQGNVLAVPAEPGARAELKGTLADGREITGLG